VCGLILGGQVGARIRYREKGVKGKSTSRREKFAKIMGGIKVPRASKE